jgi:hypothetical protein
MHTQVVPGFALWQIITFTVYSVKRRRHHQIYLLLVPVANPVTLTPMRMAAMVFEEIRNLMTMDGQFVFAEEFQGDGRAGTSKLRKDGDMYTS